MRPRSGQLDIRRLWRRCLPDTERERVVHIERKGLFLSWPLFAPVFLMVHDLEVAP